MILEPRNEKVSFYQPGIPRFFLIGFLLRNSNKIVILGLRSGVTRVVWCAVLNGDIMERA